MKQLLYAVLVVTACACVVRSLCFINKAYDYQLSTDYTEDYVYEDNFTFYQGLQELYLKNNLYLQKNNKSYGLRIATYSRNKYAIKMRNRLLMLGMKSHIKQIVTANNLVLYRLEVDPVTSRSEMSDLQDKLSSNGIPSNLYEVNLEPN